MLDISRAKKAELIAFVASGQRVARDYVEEKYPDVQSLRKVARELRKKIGDEPVQPPPIVAEVEPPKPKTQAVTKTARGRPVNNLDKKIYKLITFNPRRKNTHGWKSWELIEDGMTVAEFVKAGGRSRDIMWDADPDNFKDGIPRLELRD